MASNQTQRETPPLRLSSPNTENLAENPAQTTISYTYDSLYRLTDAVYSNGFEFHYTYDAVGNRLTQTACAPNVPCATTHYQYDDANRLIAAEGGVAYTWDDAGNLLDDGTSTYGYDSQNRLTSLTQGGRTYVFSYNGQGDRLTQSVDGVTTRYVLDLEAGLTQVLGDGSFTYLYGVDRLAQVSADGTDYFLGDALGSVRQLVDASGAVKLVKNYEPYGSVMGSAGNGTSAYGFDGEQQQGDQIYLRARFYDSQRGRFLSHDTWPGDEKQPASYNAWLFTYGNPVNLVDRDGRRPCTDWLLNSDSLPYYGWHAVGEYEQCTSSTPNVAGYDATEDPWGITFVGQTLPRLIDPSTNAPYPNQFITIPDPDPKNEECTEDSTFECWHGGYSHGLCGMGSTAAIVGSNFNDVSMTYYEKLRAQELYKCDTGGSNVCQVDPVTGQQIRTTDPNFQGATHLATLINYVYGDRFHAWLKVVAKPYQEKYVHVQDWIAKEAGADLNVDDYEAMAMQMYSWFYQTSYVIAGVRVNGSSWDPRGGELRSGKGPRFQGEGASHWVVITGLSVEWSNTWTGRQDESPWKWVRIYNPLQNRTEYYWWADFWRSWNADGSHMVRVDAANAPMTCTRNDSGGGSGQQCFPP